MGYVFVPQSDGSSAKKFRPDEVRAAYVNYCQMIEALGSDEVVEPHPFNVAVANSTDLSLRQSAFGIPTLAGDVENVGDLSEQGG